MMPGTIASARCIFGPLPLAAMPRTGTGSLRQGLAGIVGPSTISRGPTTHATRYVGRGLVFSNVRVFQPFDAGVSETSLVLATALSPAGMVSTRSNGVLKPGWSKQGNA